MTLIVHKHLQAMGYCNRGSRLFFARHGISWPQFLRNGIDSKLLSATGDAQALRLVAHAEKEAKQHGR